ncbi:N-acetylmuramoyl-L-alanine amidase [Nitrobacter winogradskyi]|uniref:N-acetylmuramoyl-L-alanine amidase n=1 Tax=Nitrobacter winogradskyi TaxID=913 RepID=A0A4Y3WAG1_NITWI|nr:N-acetylmuramoyl-L-alanine amidase [Nitrobacter winogradskyi]
MGSLACRANLGIVWLCATAIFAPGAASFAAGNEPVRPEVAVDFPVASAVRVAGDLKQTRFVLDLDRKIGLRAFLLSDPYRVVIDTPQVSFHLAPKAGEAGRGLIKAFRYGLVMPGGSRIVFDLAGPAKIGKAYVLDAANGQPSRLVVELEAVDRAAFNRLLARSSSPEPAKDTGPPGPAADTPGSTGVKDGRLVVVIDPGHGGLDNGTQASTGESEKDLVLAFGTALRDRIEQDGRFRVVMTRTDDTFIPLAERVRIARNNGASLFVSVHADALPRNEGDARGATIYTLSDMASDREAERLAEAENKADAIGGVDLTEEPTEVADILIDLARRETRTFSNRFARLLMSEMKTSARMHKHPLKSAGFRVLKAPDVPSVLVELGYVSNNADLRQMASEEWRSKTVRSVAKAIEAFLAKRVVSAAPVD